MTAYATRAELYALGIGSDALTGVSTDTQDTALEAGSRMVDSYARRRNGTPFPASAVPYELRRATCIIAAWDLLTTRGFSPQTANGDDAVKERYDNTIAWLKDVARGVAHLDDTADATPSEQEAAPLIYSDDETDWDA